MWRCFLGWLAALLVAGSCCLPAAAARGPEGPAEGPDNTERVPVLQYAFAGASLVIILLIVCRPSRKN
jgi:hypothetical protein